ncbi:MAG: SIMPL domain-containing protein [Candidatus Eremiobacteraeota bacterium]|nr:SIMPL domain-containing protein [Candidatus Eremiobacteraeota bacterium]
MKTLAWAAAAAALLIAIPCPARAASTTELSVSGIGSVTLAPDLATVDAAVETYAPSVTEAIGQNNRRYERIVAALSKLGIARADIALSNYSINYNPKPQVLPQPPTGERYGYTVSRQFTVKVRKIGDAGTVVDTCTSAGATGINNVAFGVADQSAARERATALAVADARARAETLARAANLHVVGIKSFDLAGGPSGPVPMVRMAAANPMPATQFDQSNVNVTVSVDAVFLAEP